MDKATIANPKSHYGDGKHATSHFVRQRLSGVINIGLTLFLAWLVPTMAVSDAAGVMDLLGTWYVALPLVLFVLNMAAHMRIGMGDIIDDYVHDPRLYRLSHLANTAFAGLVVLVGIGALIKLVIWG